MMTQDAILALGLDPLLKDFDFDEWVKIKRKCCDLELAYRLVGEFADHRFSIDDVSAGRLNNALSIAESTVKLGKEWPGMVWTDADNGLFPIPDIEIMRAMTVALGAQGAAVYAVWQQHKVEISGLKTVAEVKAYDTTKGWP